MINYAYVKDYISKYGYTLESEEYINTQKKLKIRCNRGHRYKGNFNHFSEGKRCPICNASKGEKLVYYILKQSLPANVAVKRERRIKIGEQNVRYDFFIDIGTGVYIEFHGEHHYRPIKAWGGVEAFLKRQEVDRVKEDYVKSTGADILILPYTLTVIEVGEQIVSLLGKYLTIGRNFSEEELLEAVKYSSDGYNIAEVANYFSSHTAAETSNKFGISEHTVYRCYKYTFGKPKTELNRVSDEEIAEFYLNNSLEDTVSMCGLDPTLVARIFKSKYGMSKYDYFRETNKTDIAYCYLDNKMDVVKDKFGISEWIVKKCFKDIFGMSKHEYKKSLK